MFFPQCGLDFKKRRKKKKFSFLRFNSVEAFIQLVVVVQFSFVRRSSSMCLVTFSSRSKKKKKKKEKKREKKKGFEFNSYFLQHYRYVQSCSVRPLCATHPSCSNCIA